ncbi:hypothetical protein NEOC95_000833 [Neochlamydia sp. AcF95]|nr:hypothetical protein [Neochlamydia sp. AcF95]
MPLSLFLNFEEDLLNVRQIFLCVLCFLKKGNRKALNDF